MTTPTTSTGPRAVLSRLGLSALEGAVAGATGLLALLGVVSAAVGWTRVALVVVLAIQVLVVALVLLLRVGGRAGAGSPRPGGTAELQRAHEQTLTELVRTRHAVLTALEELAAERRR